MRYISVCKMQFHTNIGSEGSRILLRYQISAEGQQIITSI
jgi:hypothetical protein